MESYTPVRDAFDHWLAGNELQATKLLDWVVDAPKKRLRRKQEKENFRDRNAQAAAARQARGLFQRRHRQFRALHRSRATAPTAPPSRRATAPRRPCWAARENPRRRVRRPRQGDAASSLADLVQALGCGTGSQYADKDLRYGKVIVMTDADVDGAHIASLLITFFYRETPKLIDNGHLLSRRAAAL